jgi:hypothetical protein
MERHTLDWNPEGTRNRGRSRATWKRRNEKKLQKARNSWKETKGLPLEPNGKIENLYSEEMGCLERLRIILMRVPTVFVWLRMGVQ